MKVKLEKYYSLYNKRTFIHPDPLEFLYHYKKKEDIEIVGLIASSLAFGRVSQILKTIANVLYIIGESPSDYLKNLNYTSVKKDFKGFVYRFVREKEMSAFLYVIKQIFEDYGSIEACFAAGVSEKDETILNGLVFFDREIKKRANESPGYLFADPLKGSGCKRMNLFLRWMVRKDQVDPGIWTSILSSKLIVPLDTHMHKIGLKLKLTERKTADMKTALEITKAFKIISPEDPVKYDFSLTRFGIRDDMAIKAI